MCFVIQSFQGSFCKTLKILLPHFMNIVKFIMSGINSALFITTLYHLYTSLLYININNIFSISLKCTCMRCYQQITDNTIISCSSIYINIHKPSKQSCTSLSFFSPAHLTTCMSALNVNALTSQLSPI